MKLIKRNLVKTVIGAGLAVCPFTARAQANIKLESWTGQAVGVGATYSLNMPAGAYNAGGTLSYGFVKDVFGSGGNFHGMAIMDVRGAVSNTGVEENNTQIYELGTDIKVGMGWRNILLTVSKGYVVGITSAKESFVAGDYGAGIVCCIGNNTKIYGDFILIMEHIGLNKNNFLPYKNKVELGMIYTLYRRQNSK